MDRLRTGATWGLALACSGLLALAACSSDDFGTVGGSLPLDVSQDSLLVEVSAIDILDVRSVEPELSQAPENREILYLGNRDAGGWRATPFMRFDFSQGIPDSILSSADGIGRVELVLEMLKSDSFKGLEREIRVHDLIDTLRTEDVSMESAAPLLGDALVTQSILSATNTTILLPDALVWQWMQAGSHRGIALFDLAESISAPEESRYISNFVGFASKELQSISSLLANVDTYQPRIDVYVTGISKPFPFPVILDFSIVERSPPASDALVLASHDASRCWIRFDLGSGVIPGDATINRALLTLVVDDSGTIAGSSRAPSGVGVNLPANRSTLAYEVLESDLGEGVLSSGDAILRSASQVIYVGEEPAGTRAISMDVTDFVQRSVNLVVPPEAGILIRFSGSGESGELLFFDAATFYGPSANEALRPRLSVTFTPPADTWR